jgi:NADP-dependent 3-hydroxy acid dehydrogenase YdfG
MNPVVLITGGSKGIGLAIAARFLAEGFAVIICARSQSSLSAAKESYPGLDCVRCDVTDKNDLQALASHVLGTYGAPDVLVNNAGVFRPGMIHREDDALFETIMQTNLFSAYYLTKRLLPAMMEKRGGTIFNMCSTASITPYVNGGSYCISKHALLGFSKVLRKEMIAYDIRVISILPGATYTASWAGTELPEGRFMPAEDIADVIWNAYQMSNRTVVEEIVIRPMAGDIPAS